MKIQILILLKFLSAFWKDVSLQTPGNVTKRKNMTRALAIWSQDNRLYFRDASWDYGLANPLALRLCANSSKKSDKAIKS